ncbi:MAG: M1 family aminopeptidase [Bacteroidota bacterium]
MRILLSSALLWPLLSLLFLAPNNLLAQPDHHHDHFGCHFTHNQVPRHALTPEEIRGLELSNERSDTIDILDYEITLEIIDYTGRFIDGYCDIRFTPRMDAVDRMSLDLLEFDVHRILLGSDSLNYSNDGLRVEVEFPAMNVGDTSTIRVFYSGNPVVDPTGFGGMDFSNNYIYNLGIGLGSNPYNYGRGWFPCFDNFRERSTFGFNIITANGRKAYCSGTFLEEQSIGGDTIMRSYRLSQAIPTYLAGVAVSNYREVNSSHQGLDRMIPTQLLARSSDTSEVKTSFAELGDCIDVLEFWYGPYAWERVGFVMTVRGAMEHAENIAYPVAVGAGGLTNGQNRLMAHELCHHWWGNVVNHDTPADMWIKEGNAEYGAFLFTEYTRGKTAFINQVRANHLRVITEAHVDDDNYWPLSGIPFEHTYGTHTYYKGADMLHNMRSYLGDSLFRVGQQAVLNDYGFSSKNAAEYRDKLTEATGVDMSPYFDAWIFNPGFSAYEIDSVQVQATGNEYDVTVFFEQKLRAAPEFHRQTPLMVTFIGENWEKEIVRMMSDGQYSSATTTLSFEPKIQFINENQDLSLAQWSNQQVIDNDLNYGFALTDFQIQVNEIEDSAYVNVDHYWVGPDDFADPNVEARISSRHYWRVSGVLPEVFDASATVEWNGRGEVMHDIDLVEVTEDSIILVYRPNAGVDWREYPYYSVINIIPTDQAGLVRIDSLLMGEYAFANGEVPLPVNTQELEIEKQLSVFPNPSNGQFTVELPFTDSKEINFSISDVLGQSVYQSQSRADGGQLSFQLADQALSEGIYLLQLYHLDGHLFGQAKLQISQ